MATRSTHSYVFRRLRARCVTVVAATIVGALVFLAVPTPAGATPTTFTLSGVTATFDVGGGLMETDTFNGTFTFDSTTFVETNVSLIPSGTLILTGTGTYTQIAAYNTGSNNSILSVNSDDNPLDLIFAGPLDGSGPDTVTNVTFGPYFSTLASGQAIPSGNPNGTPMPEPSSFVMLGAGLVGLLGAMHWKRIA